MPDIAMCKGDGCPIKEDCYRYKAKPTPERQSYFSVVPYDVRFGCEHYWEMYDQKGKKNVRAGQNL